ncbi:hypothetical protein CBM2609_A170103 [Cupriavidus taiwanensis]|uniref:hypothetical protein n=1 Tax=Cupriavidus taiwanensis TaxID=164546 RepID=UPI000E136740|nr:hypothetical protein [Cupriavidus taiwanensis]SOZ14442.1 hypothetical protein CBM2604_A140106 [Cupriavidus taiwanensis]SOZ25842.1 hypothetical protein CBM2609_A170103 [Cupriavidus taiwanensis]SOZ45049.1 hypothetical protein CBM2610_A160102 [Cupriavidus taiwanensis]
MNGFQRLPVLVEAIDVRFQLLAVTKDLLTALLKGTPQMVGRSRANIVPEYVLFSPIGSVCCCVFGPNSSALGVSNILVTKCSRKFFGALANYR